MSRRNERALLEDIMDASQKAVAFLRGLGVDDLESDNERTGLAVRKALEIVGEAANRLSPELRSHYPEIEWHKLIGMRTSTHPCL